MHSQELWYKRHGPNYTALSGEVLSGTVHNNWRRKPHAKTI